MFFHSKIWTARAFGDDTRFARAASYGLGRKVHEFPAQDNFDVRQSRVPSEMSFTRPMPGIATIDLADGGAGP